MVVVSVGPLVAWFIAWAIVLTYLARTSRPSASLAAEVASAQRHSTLMAAVAMSALVVLGLGLWFHVVSTDDVNGSPLAAVSPLLASSVALLALVLGEVTWPRPQGTLRSARLLPRSAWSLTSRYWCTLASLSVLALTVVTLWGGAIADDSGRRLRGNVGGFGSAFPGWHYGGPQLLSLALAVLLTVAVVRLATWRAAVVDADAEIDDVLRRASIVRSLKMLTVGSLVCLAGDLYIAGNALGSEYAGDWPATVGSPLQGLAVVLIVLAVAITLVPAPRLSRTQASALPAEVSA